jgi:autotransporter-associated beta strand protein
MSNSTWTGAFSSDYDDFHNWTSGVPGNSDIATFGTVTNTAVTVLATHVGAWQFTGGSYAITIGTFDAVYFTGAGVQVTGGSATIEVNHSSFLQFSGPSDGGTAAYVLHPHRALLFVGTGPNGDGIVHVGSLAGDSTSGVSLGEVGAAQELVVGGNNLSTTFAGEINSNNSGDSLVKVGTGTWTWSGNFGGSFSGPITIAGGTLDLDTANAVPGGFVFGANAAETLTIENAALPGNGFAPPIAALGAGNTIDLPGLPFVPGATTTGFGMVTNGTTTVHFFSVSVAGANDEALALGDDHGGTRVMLGILGTSGKNLVDGIHHPAGQVSSTNAPDLILGLGGNDTMNGLGGNDILVGGAGKDMLYGGRGADTFVYQQLSDSKPAHPDIIEDFKHAHHDKIDLFDLFHAANHVALRFIGGETFAQYYHAHPTVFGMVRYAGGEVQVNVNVNFAPDLAIVMHGAPALHAGDFIL